MNPELFALLTLGFYLSVAVGLVARSIRRCEDGCGVWLLFLVQRLYSPGMFHWRAANPPCPFPESAGALIVANHRSPIDPMMVWTNNHFRAGRRNIRVVGFLTAREYCEIPGLRWLLRTMGCIPVDRNGQDMGPIREAIRRLKNGRLVGIFPEGGLNYDEDLRQPNSGVAFLALKAKVPVYPVFIHGASQDGNSMVTPFVQRQRITVTYGDAIELSEYHGVKATPEVLVEITNLLMSRLADLGGVGYTPARVEVRKERMTA